jgi:hypothetical protein
MTKPRMYYETDGTNITKELQEKFDFILNAPHSKESVLAGEHNVALVSCFVNGEPAAAICAAVRRPDGGFILEPLFVSVTPGMVIVDHDGVAPGKQ